MGASSRSSGDSEVAVRHGNCRMRKLKDQAMAFEEKTSNCCLTKALSGFALEIAIGCGWL